MTEQPENKGSPCSGLAVYRNGSLVGAYVYGCLQEVFTAGVYSSGNDDHLEPLDGGT